MSGARILHVTRESKIQAVDSRAQSQSLFKIYNIMQVQVEQTESTHRICNADKAAAGVAMLIRPCRDCGR